MCLPLLPMIAIGASLAATGVSAYGAIKQGNDARSAANYNANAQRQTAISVENQGAQAAADQIQKGRKVSASQAAAGAAGGIRTDTGTPLNLAGETAGFAELDALRITNNAQRQAWGYQTQANIDEWQGKQAQQAGYMQAGSTLLSGASSAFFGASRLSDNSGSGGGSGSGSGGWNGVSASSAGAPAFSW